MVLLVVAINTRKTSKANPTLGVVQNSYNSIDFKPSPKYDPAVDSIVDFTQRRQKCDCVSYAM